MIWLTWRQFRSQAIVFAVAFVGIGIVLAYTGPHLVHLYDSSGIRTCGPTAGNCRTLVDAFDKHYGLLKSVDVLLLFIPAVVGAFWAAPPCPRLESGTYRVAWTQSVTRTRWLATKVAIVGGVCVIGTAAATAVISWWMSPIDAAHPNRFSPTLFSDRGIVPAAYAAFAFGLGLLLGAVIRRTLPAMAATLAGFLAVRIVVQNWVRPRFASPVHVTTPLFSDKPLGSANIFGPSVWTIKMRMVDVGGHVVDPNTFMRSRCGIDLNAPNPVGKGTIGACAEQFGLHNALTVQPADRYWTFQVWEAALFVGLAAACIGLAFWWVRRRIS